MAAMTYVDLDRRFRVVEADKPIDVTDLSAYGFAFAGGLAWSDLLNRPRVIVLAEALAGKTQEFRSQCAKLRGEGKTAFYLTVEALAQSGLDGSLSRQDADAFTAWRSGTATAWFFLDSVDEARINRRDITTAFNRFARELGIAYDRARVLISCRGTVWTGEDDLVLVRNALPASPPPPAPAASTEDPLYAAKAEKTQVATKPVAVPEFTVVALTTLTRSQRQAYLVAQQVPDADAFEKALFDQHLQQYAERPGDLAMLVRYWKHAGRFDGLAAMTAAGVTERLKEIDRDRQSLLDLPAEVVEAGAERLAAAMTLSRTMSIRLPGADTNEQGLDAHQLLSDWHPGHVDALLQRGLFVPSTFNLIRIFHRSAQEYLAARWFHRLGAKLTDNELLRIFFSDRFGIHTVPPSLRAVAGWLALWKPVLRRELLKHEPLILIQHGDPRELALDEKAALLARYAERQKDADIAYTRLDTQALWLFAEPGLGAAINDAIKINDRGDFRFNMLRLVEQGEICDCQAFARSASLGPTSDPYSRIVATRALRLFDDADGLRAAAEDLLKSPGAFGPDLAPHLAVSLFPTALSVPELLTVIEESRPGREFGNNGFSDELETLFHACRSVDDRKALITGIAEIAFRPKLADWPRVSARHVQLVRHLGGLARAAILDADLVAYGPELELLLMAVERGGEARRQRGSNNDLADLVAARPALKQRLVWADVRRAIDIEKVDRDIRSWRQVQPHEGPLWSILPEDHDWLVASLKRASDEARIALSALIDLARSGAEPEEALDRLASIVSDDPALTAMLVDARTPIEESGTEKKYRLQSERLERKRYASDEAWRRDLAAFRAKLQADQRTLTDPALLVAPYGFRDLWGLNQWMLSQPNADQGMEVRLQSLEAAFGPVVALAFREGMSTMWRVTAPEAPKRKPNGVRNVKFAIMTAVAGLEMEAQQEGWVARLDAELVTRATEHACLDEQGVPDWIAELLVTHEIQVAPMVADAIEREWKGGDIHRPFLAKAAHGLPLGRLIRAKLLSLMTDYRGTEPELLEDVRLIIARIEPSAEERAKLFDCYEQRLADRQAAGDWKGTQSALATLFTLEPERAVPHLLTLIGKERRRRHKSRAWGLLAKLFGRHRGLVPTFDGLSTEKLRAIVVEAYRERARPPHAGDDDDEDDEDAGDHRDRFDEAGGVALTALLARDGQEAFDAMLSLSRDKTVGASMHRLRELAYEMAERQSERDVWSAESVRRFEEKALAPLGSGADLQALTLELLDDIQRAFENDDMSARRVVMRATQEEDVQDWLGGALIERAEKRFHAFKEAEAAGAKRPDLVLAAIGTSDQLAVEVKHAEKGWTFPALMKALEVQLAQQYLRPANRRHGVFVISNHRKGKYWLEGGKQLSFSDGITKLQEAAAKLTDNKTGSIWVAVRGIDASVGKG